MYCFFIMVNEDTQHIELKISKFHKPFFQVSQINSQTFFRIFLMKLCDSRQKTVMSTTLHYTYLKLSIVIVI